MLHAYGDHTVQDFAHLRIAVAGGSVLPMSIAAEFESKFGYEVAAALPKGQHLQNPASISTG